MPIPLILAGAALVAAGVGVAKGAKAVSNNNEAKRIIEEANSDYESAKRRLECQREDTSERLSVLGEAKLNAWSNGIGRFLTVYSSFKRVEFQAEVAVDRQEERPTPEMLGKMETASVKATEVLTAGAGALGAGALAGIASYGGTMMFATASTGTAIASLSGAAATNATLAWLGGGSLAAGGFGMAGGAAVLGGIVVGPILAVAGFIMAAKSEENLASAKRTRSEAQNAIEKMEVLIDMMRGISSVARNYEEFILRFMERYVPVLEEVERIREDALVKQNSFANRLKRFFGREAKVDFGKLDIRSQKTLHIAWLMTQLLFKVTTTPILKENGDLDTQSQTAIESANEQLPILESEKNKIELIPRSTYQNQAEQKRLSENYKTESHFIGKIGAGVVFFLRVLGRIIMESRVYNSIFSQKINMAKVMGKVPVFIFIVLALLPIIMCLYSGDNSFLCNNSVGNAIVSNASVADVSVIAENKIDRNNKEIQELITAASGKSELADTSQPSEEIIMKNEEAEDFPENDSDLSMLWGRWVQDEEWYIELSERLFTTPYHDGPMRVDDYFFEDDKLHIYFSVDPFDTGYVWSYYGVVSESTMALLTEIGEGYGYGSASIYVKEGVKSADLSIINSIKEHGKVLCGYDYNGNELYIGYYVRIGADMDGCQYAVGTIEGYLEEGTVQVEFTEVIDVDEHGQTDYYYIEGIADEIRDKGSATHFVDADTLQILFFG